ncbi:hypothetical protein Hanom_Chr05g00436501 [Helianthus anomalus]
MYSSFFFSNSMTKMVTRSSPNKDQDHESQTKSQNLLKNPSTELCRFADPEVDQLYTCFPPGIVFQYFDSSLKSDLISYVWIISDEELDFNLSELSRLYNLVYHGSHQFLFKVKPHHPLPLLKTTKNDTSWRNQFFFVRRDTVPLGNSLPKK